MVETTAIFFDLEHAAGGPLRRSEPGMAGTISPFACRGEQGEPSLSCACAAGGGSLYRAGCAV